MRGSGHCRFFSFSIALFTRSSRCTRSFRPCLLFQCIHLHRIFLRLFFLERYSFLFPRRALVRILQSLSLERRSFPMEAHLLFTFHWAVVQELSKTGPRRFPIDGIIGVDASPITLVISSSRRSSFRFLLLAVKASSLSSFYFTLALGSWRRSSSVPFLTSGVPVVSPLRPSSIRPHPSRNPNVQYSATTRPLLGHYSAMPGYFDKATTRYFKSLSFAGVCEQSGSMRGGAWQGGDYGSVPEGTT